jgi:parvulin-like peptidyl-prolyl isomerase
VLILVIVSFVLVPAFVPEGRRGGGDLTFGYYDDVPISYVPGNYFAQSQERIARYYQSSADINSLQYYQSVIWQQAFESAAVHTAILQEMKKANYSVPVKTVDRQVAQLPMFQENGRFSPALYQKMSGNASLALWRQIQDEITKNLYIGDMLGLLKSPKEEVLIGNMASNARNFEMVFFSVDDYPASEYLAYAREHSDVFKSVHLSRISVNSGEREARQILTSVKDGTATFEDAARAQSQDNFADRGGDMGIRYIFELEQEITETAVRENIIRLEKGALSDVVKVGDRWAFFRTEEELKEANFEDEAVMEKVRSYMRNFERGRMEDRAIAQARDFIADANAADFDTALDRVGKEKNSFGPLPINYGSVDLFSSIESFSMPQLSRSELSSLSMNENFWKIAFTTPLNSLSEPLVQGSNVFVFLPTEQTDIEESIEKAESAAATAYSSYWLNYTMEQTIHNYFMNSAKMDNRFIETYYRYFTPFGY